MLHRLKNRGQNTAEYALLIALVVAGTIAIQQYAQRAIQGRVRDASVYMTKNPAGSPAGLDSTAQYEPYYQQSDYSTARQTQENKRQGVGLVAQDSRTDRVRSLGGQQTSTYEAAGNANAPTSGTRGLRTGI